MSNMFESLKSLLLPADVHPDVDAYLSQADDHQVVFMEFNEDVLVPEHSHGPQLEIVLAGQVELTISGNEKLYKTGDWFYLKDGEPHAGKLTKGYKSVAVFFQKDRYSVKKS